MKVLLTGCTAQQANSDSHKRIVNYAGLLRKALHLSGHEVFWREPSVSWTLDDILGQYDHVIVGLAPVTSLSANRVYGALSVLGELFKTDMRRLSILLDAPEPSRIAAGNRAVLAHPENLCKPFYAYRKEYELAARDQSRLLGVVERLHAGDWPTTLVQALPWDAPRAALNRMPYSARRVISINLDRLLIDELTPLETRARQGVWLTEGQAKQLVSLPQHPIPRKGQVAWDDCVRRQMSMALGVLVESPKDGTWWNTRYAQALSTGTPVFSNWEETGRLGAEWSVLPMNAETAQHNARAELARRQLTLYWDHATSHEDIASGVARILRTRVKANV